MIAVVTGHRPQKILENGKPDYEGSGSKSKAIRAAINEFVEEYKVSKMISGMALGVDTIFAEEAIKLECHCV